MNLLQILQSLQDYRARLEDWGITSQGLWIAGGVAVVLFFFSLREVLSWYLRMQQVRDEVRALRSDLATLQNVIEETRNLVREQNELHTEAAEEQLVKNASLKSSVASETQNAHNRFRFNQ